MPFLFLPIWQSVGGYRYTFADMIEYSEIYTRCEQMSSYEGGRAYNEQGDSLYEIVHITEQDQILVNEFTRQAVDLICRAVKYLIIDVNMPSDDGIKITFDTYDTSIQFRSTLDSDLISTVVSYVMWKWLENKLPDRAKAWEQIFETSLSSIKRCFTRRKPFLI